MKINTCTVFQNHLMKRTIHWPIIARHLGVDRTAPSKWANGIVFPSKPNADKLIHLFGIHGVELDYNDLYHVMEMAS